MELENDLVDTDAIFKSESQMQLEKQASDSWGQDLKKLDSRFSDIVFQDEEDADLCGLVFGHDELPSNLMSHLPSIVNSQKKGRFTQEINFNVDLDAPK